MASQEQEAVSAVLDGIAPMPGVDLVGWGYSLFLPWATYKPEINRVHLKVRYLPLKGGPLYAASAPMTLGDPEQMKKLATDLARGFKKNEGVQREGSVRYGRMRQTHARRRR